MSTPEQLQQTCEEYESIHISHINTPPYWVTKHRHGTMYRSLVNKPNSHTIIILDLFRMSSYNHGAIMFEAVYKNRSIHLTRRYSNRWTEDQEKFILTPSEFLNFNSWYYPYSSINYIHPHRIQKNIEKNIKLLKKAISDHNNNMKPRLDIHFAPCISNLITQFL